MAVSVSFLKLTKLFSFSSFVRKMAENVASEGKHIERTHRIQQNILSEMYAIEHEAKIRQKVDIESSIENL
jgi:hypothetical protein